MVLCGRQIVALLGAAAAIAAQPAGSSLPTEWSSYGSGDFGNWSADEFGLPRYTVGTRAALGKISKANGGFLHQFGNDRMILVAMTDGSVAMRQDEGGAKFLNSRDEQHGQHGGAVGILSEGSQVLLHTLDNGIGNDVEMQLGSGYFRRRLDSAAARLSMEHTVIAPHGDHSFAVIAVNITNESPRARSLKYVETWSRLMRELHTPGRWKQIVKEKHVSAADFALGVTHRVQRSNVSAPGLFDTVLPPAGGPAAAPPGSAFPAASQHDYNPRPAFLRVIDGGSPPTRVGCNATALFPDGSSLHPYLHDGLTCEVGAVLGPEAMLALELDVEVAAFSSTVRYLAFGYVAPGSTESTALPGQFIGKDKAAAAWKASSEAWLSSSIRFSAPEGAWLERETLWHSHMLRGALTYDSYWDGFVLDQNGGYMYASGDNDALARDPLNHALPLLFYAPQATRGGIRMAVSSTHNKMYSGGRLPKASFGFGLGYQTGKDSATALDRGDWCCYPSDLELWILNAAMRYVLVTRDWGFLAELIETAWGEITMADALWRINHHLFEVESADGGVGLGPHGLLRMLTMDYNDGILLAPGNDTMNISLNNRSAESVLNSAQAVGILQSYSAILAAVPPAIAHKFGNLSTNITHLQMLETQQRESVEATWGGRWFARMWSPDSGGWFGTEHNASIWWSNAFPLLHKISPTDQPAQRERLVNAIDAGLLDKNPTGIPFSNKSAHADYQDSWFAGGMWLLEALGQRGYQHLAYKAWKKGLLSTHATKFPSQFAGIYSASDHYADGKADYGDANGATVDSAGGGVAVFNSWAHTTPLLGVMALIGAEFDVNGVTLRPSGLRPNATGTFQSYNVSTPILGLAKVAGQLGYSGWYTPLVQDGACTVRVELSAADAARLKTLMLNGQHTPLVMQKGVAVIHAAVCNVRWELRPGV